MNVIQFYFSLQIKRLSRTWNDAGIHPYIGNLLAILLFLLFSNVLFYRIEDAPLFYSAFGLLVLFSQQKASKNLFLQSVFTSQQCRLIMAFESLVTVLPFSLFLSYRGELLWSALLLFTAIGIGLVYILPKAQVKIFTPFKKYPFEFISGFRKSFVFYLLSYFFLIKGIQVDNFNLAIASLVLVYLVCMTYYFFTEPLYYVWIYTKEPSELILHKIKTACICSLIAVAPLIAILSFFYFSMMWAVLLICISGTSLLITMLLAKYSAYPEEIGLPQAILLVLCIWFPPLILIVIPIFYRKAVSRLRLILL